MQIKINKKWSVALKQNLQVKIISSTQDSDYIKDHQWLWKNFPTNTRFHSLIGSKMPMILFIKV